MSLVLRAKHWQIFLILIGFLVIEVIALPFGELAADLSYLIYITFEIGWFLVLGFELNKRCKPKRTFWPVLSVGLIVILFGWIFRLSMDLAETASFIENLEPYKWYAFGTFSIASMVLISAFPAKALKLIEMNEEVDINDYFKDFLSILFWPIGVWFIQPRINKIVD